MQPNTEGGTFRNGVEDRRLAPRASGSSRRRYDRLHQPYVALVRGVDSRGESFTESTTLNDVGAGGLNVRLHREVPLGTRLLVVFSFSTVALTGVPAAKLAAHGVVQRVDGGSGVKGEIQSVGIKFDHYRFL